jgi:hypothetical protein
MIDSLKMIFKTFQKLEGLISIDSFWNWLKARIDAVNFRKLNYFRILSILNDFETSTTIVEYFYDTHLKKIS